MKTTIGPYNSLTKSVTATFEHNGVTHERSVNACHTEKGGYDKKATAARIEEVANGVAVKIDMGVITNTPTDGAQTAE